MKYFFQFCRILVFCFLGELLHALLPLPIPSGIYGLVLLTAALLLKIVRLEQIRETALFLSGVFPLLFVPSTVGLMTVWEEIRAMLIPILIAMIPITVLVMGVSGTVTQFLEKRRGKRHDGS